MDQSENKKLWDRVCKTDPKHTTAIVGKDYKGTSPKPFWIVSRLTDEFGPCGIGWGFSIVDERFQTFETADGKEVLHVAKVKFWYLLNGVRGEIEQMGQTKASYLTSKGGTKIDEDAPKKSVTDALVKCASYLGFAGDIFLGRWDDSKYVSELKKEFSEAGNQPTGLTQKARADFLAALDSCAEVSEIEKLKETVKSTCQQIGDSEFWKTWVSEAKTKVNKLKGVE